MMGHMVYTKGLSIAIKKTVALLLVRSKVKLSNYHQQGNFFPNLAGLFQVIFSILEDELL